MTRAVVLDSGPLGLLTSPPGKKNDGASCARWLAALVSVGTRVVVPEIADYEIRRELLRAGKTKSVARLNALASTTEYIPLTTMAMRHAAFLWAKARQRGQPTAADDTIDVDVILAAQALTLQADVVVATTNVGHLSRFVSAQLWTDIQV